MNNSSVEIVTSLRPICKRPNGELRIEEFGNYGIGELQDPSFLESLNSRIPQSLNLEVLCVFQQRLIRPQIKGGLEELVA